MDGTRVLPGHQYHYTGTGTNWSSASPSAWASLSGSTWSVSLSILDTDWVPFLFSSLGVRVMGCMALTGEALPYTRGPEKLEPHLEMPRPPRNGETEEQETERGDGFESWARTQEADEHARSTR